MEKDLVIIGGGPAGLAAAAAAYDGGARDILVLEREERTGGVLKQCVHNGFGLTRFKENLTGPEYAERFRKEAARRGIEIWTGAYVTAVNADKRVTVTSPKGIENIDAKAVVFAMGCRERSKGALEIAGTRPAGIFSAGTAQKYVNVYGVLPGKKAVILGSGDIGLIMARRLTLEGAEVACVAEIMPYSSGLKRNVEQCLNDFSVPLYLNTTAVGILGKKRVEGVVLASVDENRRPLPGTERTVECDTVLFSVGLIPENELPLKMGLKLNPLTKGLDVDENRQTETDGVFACGNVLHVHDLVDFVSEEAETAGRAAARYLKGERRSKDFTDVVPGKNVGYVLPQKIGAKAENVKIFFRVKRPLKNASVTVRSGENLRKTAKSALLPGEMCSITVSAAELKGVTKIEISAEGELIYG